MNERPPETRHLPVPDAETEPYWSAAAEGRLVFRRCEACGLAYHYPRARCPRCLSEWVRWEDAIGSGTIHTYTVVRQNGARPFRERLPYVLALVDLDEGPRLMSTIEGAPADAVEIGARVRVAFRRETDDVTLPVFELEAAP